jgi:hypothetical protein
MPAKAATTSTQPAKPILKALHVTLENKPGFLAKVTRALASAKINIEAVEAEILGKSAFFRFYTQTPVEAEAVLRKLGLITVGMDILEVEMPNTPGELARLCDTLAANNINIESTFGSSSGTSTSKFYLRVDKPQEAHKILTGAQFTTRRTNK